MILHLKHRTIHALKLFLHANLATDINNKTSGNG